MKKTHAFAILAPVPEEHLKSGLDAISKQLSASDQSINEIPKLAYGSMAFEEFRKVDQLRGDSPIEVFIYASHAAGDQPLNPVVSWRGLYVGHSVSRNGRYAGNLLHRPESTKKDRPVWAVFWNVTDLQQLETPIPIGSLRGLAQKTNYKPRFIPEGPLLIESP
jgi:hypothetical protein